MSGIAFFDFDGTITTRDTMPEFISFYCGRTRMLAGFLLNAPYILAYKLGIMSNHAAKQRLFRFFFKGESIPAFEKICQAFADGELPALIRPKATHEIEKLKQAGFKVVVVSASAENWIRPWCTANQIECIGTRLATNNMKLTGRIDGRNCHGQEKVLRIESAYALSSFNAIYCYGDTPGDRPMLSLGTISFYKPFR